MKTTMTHVRVTRPILLAVITAGLVACGGGGGNAGANKYEQPVAGAASGSTTSGSGTGAVASNAQATVVLALSSAQISSSSPGTVTASVKSASGAPIKNALVTFSSSGTIAVLSPLSVVTNDAGEAATSLRPSSSSAAGGAFVTAEVEIPGVSTKFSTKVAFSVSALNVTLTAASAAKPNLTAYESTNLSFSVSGASASNPVKVLLTSTCTQSGKAKISPQSVTLTQTSGSAAYQDQGCASPDLVNVSIEGTSQSQSVNLNIAAPISTAIQFVSANPPVIGLKGSGSPTSSLVVFKVTDQQGLGVSGQGVTFSLDQPNIATLTASTGTTGSDGTVTVGVNAINTPSPVRVRAALSSNVSVFVPSSELTINAGRPHQNGFSMAFQKYAMNGNLDGDESEVRLTLADRYGNPVPDGTRATLVSEGGVVIPASCTTTDAVCKVKFVVSNPRPADGRVAITAYAVGEESYTDLNGDLDYTSPTPEPFGDLGVVFLDKNENDVSDASDGEYITGTAANGVWDSNGYVRETATLFFSQTNQAPRFYTVNPSTGACTSTAATLPLATVNMAITQLCTQTVAFCLRDANTAADALGGNPIASGSTLDATVDAEGATTEVSNSPVPDALASPTRHVISVKRSSCGSSLTSGGQVALSVKMGSTTYRIPGVVNVVP